jgi:hypothetical protein
MNHSFLVQCKVGLLHRSNFSGCPVELMHDSKYEAKIIPVKLVEIPNNRILQSFHRA